MPELCLLTAGKVKKAQRELPAAIADAHQQVAATAKRGLGQKDLAGHEAALAGNERAELYQLRAVFIAQRQQEQQILDTMEVQPFQFPGERRAHPGERCKG